MRGSRPRRRTEHRALAALTTALAALLALWVVTCLLPMRAAAGDAVAPTPDAAGSPVDAPAKAAHDAHPHDAAETDALLDPEVAALRLTAERIRDLIAGKLEVTVAPRSLFDCDLDDAKVVAVERARLRALLDATTGLGASAAAAAAPVPDDGGTNADARSDARPDARSDARSDAGPEVDEGDVHVSAKLPTLGTPLGAARLALDRARLAFYDLPWSSQRAALETHAEQQKAAQAASPETEAAKRAREAADEKERALEKARLAKSEAERAVAEEYARLLDVEHAQVVWAEALGAVSKATNQRREATLRWKLRLRELREATPVVASVADATYDELRATLRDSRDALSEALSGGASTPVPTAGPDPLAELQLTTEQIRAERRKLDAEAQRLDVASSQVEAERLSELLEETTVLNRERLLLLPFLSPAKRDGLIGFTDAGRDQAASELEQLTLILRYHVRAAVAWARSLRHPGVGFSAARVGVVLLEAAGLALALAWWRRRARVVLEAASERLREADRLARASTQNRWLKVLGLVQGIRGPLEGLLFVLVLLWILPDALRQTLEVELLFVLLTWTLVGRILVGAVDTLAVVRPGGRANKSLSHRNLRHRSLRMVSRVVVVFGVVLVSTAKLVGTGTLYEWVLSTCWFASIPLFLVLIRWWRDVVFERIARARKPSPIERWVLSHKTGWASFFAASAGGVFLFTVGFAKAFRAWIGRFELTRKALAYLFRRRLDKMGAETAELVFEPLEPALFDALGPTASPLELWVTTEVDESIDALGARVEGRRGGVVALVGERGAGKTTALRRVVGASPTSCSVETPPEGLDALRALLAARCGLGADASLDAIADALVASEAPAIVLDDFQHFVEPVMGGLAAFDTFLSVANRHSAKTTWIFAFDAVTWQFLERARSVRPIFDEIIQLPRWREEEIAELLRMRTEHAGLTPSFEPLLDELPPDADEVDRREALDARAASFRRLVWDSAAGNPGIALHLWRRSLGRDAEGKSFVRVFPALDLRDLERLPDSAVFVLRAVLQLSPAMPERIVEATMLRLGEVNDALRYALARGYLEEAHGRFRVTWTWFRAITLFLQRRHLLVST